MSGSDVYCTKRELGGVKLTLRHPSKIKEIFWETVLTVQSLTPPIPREGLTTR